MDGQQPRNTHVMRNYVHEFGHYQKQSSMWSNNKACLAQVEGNIVFNGPRVNPQPRPSALFPLPPAPPALSSDSVSLRRVLWDIRPGSTSTCDNAFSAVLSSFACAEHGRLVCNRTGSVAART